MRRVAALVLAAGRGSRFGTGADDSKVLAAFRGRPLVRHVAETALASQASATFVVTGHAAAGVAMALAGLPTILVPNPDYANGMAGSVRAGVAALPPNCDGVLMLLADMPCVAAATLDALIASFAASGAAPEAVVPTYEGRHGNPVLIGRGLFAEVSRLDGDAGARRLLRHPGRTIVACPVDDPGVEIDIDTRAALRALDEDRD